MTEDDDTPQPAIDLKNALEQMAEDGNPPDGFHMMFFSEEFKMAEDCPINVLLRKITTVYDCSDTLRRQVYQMPTGRNILSYEFAWLGDFNQLQTTMEDIDRLVNEAFGRMIEDGTLSEPPKARVQFLKEAPPEDNPDE